MYDAGRGLNEQKKGTRINSNRSASPFPRLDVIGYAFALNGKMVTADMFGSSAVFHKVWPKLIRANAVEAVAELQKDKKFAAVTAAAVKSFLDDAEQGKAASKDVLKGIQQTTRENAKSVLFETLDQRKESSFIRRNYLAK